MQKRFVEGELSRNYIAIRQFHFLLNKAFSFFQRKQLNQTFATIQSLLFAFCHEPL